MSIEQAKSSNEPEADNNLMNVRSSCNSFGYFQKPLAKMLPFPDFYRLQRQTVQSLPHPKIKPLYLHIFCQQFHP